MGKIHKWEELMQHSTWITDNKIRPTRENPRLIYVNFKYFGKT